jgi:RNA polymerase sigma-70 factor (ECF subfamily)
VPEQVAETERASLVRRAMSRLNAEQQLVIELSYFRGLTRREIAQQLKWPEGTVHTRARLALQNLRQQLNELGLDPNDLQ